MSVPAHVNEGDRVDAVGWQECARQVARQRESGGGGPRRQLTYCGCLLRRGEDHLMMAKPLPPVLFLSSLSLERLAKADTPLSQLRTLFFAAAHAFLFFIFILIYSPLALTAL